MPLIAVQTSGWGWVLARGLECVVTSNSIPPRDPPVGTHISMGRWRGRKWNTDWMFRPRFMCADISLMFPCSGCCRCYSRLLHHEVEVAPTHPKSSRLCHVGRLGRGERNAQNILWHVSGVIVLKLISGLDARVAGSRLECCVLYQPWHGKLPCSLGHEKWM